MVTMRRGRGGVTRNVYAIKVAEDRTLTFVTNGDSPITLTFGTAKEKLDLALALLRTLPAVFLAADDAMCEIVQAMQAEQANARAAVEHVLSDDHLVHMGRPPQ